jgi:RHS repeat-associated protein
MSNVTNCDPGDVGYQDISVTWPGNSIARTIDLDGDGLVDYVRTRAENPNFLDCRPGPLPANWTVWRNPGPEGLLSQVTNELGGTTKIEYKPSNWMKSLQEVPETPAPPSDIVRDGRPRWVVTKVEVKDGRAGTATESESMAYAGFRFDQVRRESFGVRTAQDADAEGLVTQSVFHQVPEKRGKLEHQQKCKGGTCFEQMDTQWDVIHEPVPDKSFLVRPTLTTTTVHACAEGSPPGGCSASDAAQVRVVQRTFEPDTGLLKSETDAGADAVLGTTDDLVHTLSYAKNTDEWIVSTVFEDSLYAGTVGSANLISQSRLYYDAAAAGGGTPTTPQRCTGGSGLCGALVSFRETLRDLSTTWAVEHWTYDSAGNMTQYFDPKAVAAAGGATQTVAYDTGEHNAFPVSIWNALSHESQFRFDATLGEVTKALTPGGHLRCFDYDDFGRLSARSELGTSTDSIDSTCDTPLASFAFENLGDPESQHITESLYPNATTALQSLRYFDGLGREYQNESMHKASDGSFDVVTRAFGDRGELACETLPFRRTGGLAGSSPVSCFAQTPRRETSYDPVLRLVQVDRVEPGGGRVTEVTSAYAINGFSLTSSVGALLVERRTTTGGPGAGSQAPTPDRIQAFGRDNRGQVVALWDGDNPNAVTRLDRDAKGRIIRVDGPDVALASGGSDPNLLEIAYNAVDQRTRIAQPMTPGEQTSAPRWLFTYDLDGDLYEQTSPRNVTIRFHHDVLRRLVLEDFAPLTTNPATPGAGDIVHEYWSSTSGIDLPKAVYGRHGIRDDFAYDWRGRLANKTRTYWGSMQFAFGYSYDWLDRPSITVMPDASSISYTYDGAQLTQAFSAVWLAGNILTVDAVVSGIDAHPSGGLTNLIFASPAFPTQPGVQSTYSYGPGDHRLASATTVRAGSLAPLQQLLYTYDTAGNLRRSDDVQGALDQDFAYDLFHRLAEVDTGPLSYGTETYQYDDAGNILFKGPADAQGQLRLLYDRTASQPTHLATVDQRQAGGGWTPGAGSYAINQDGGVTQRTKGSQVLNLWRNAEGMAQLISDSSVPQTSVTYHYDATGRRSEKLVTGAWGTVSADRYSVDASFEVDTVNVTHEVHLFVGGRRVATSERTGFGNGVLPESLLSVTTYHPDQVGTNTVTVRTTATGQTVSTTVLDPFGQKKSGAGPEPRHLFTDQERDAETGLDYFGARYYDSWVGRFIEEDPELIGSSVGGTFARIGVDAANLNGYAYALNRPTTVTDPTGADAEGSGGAPDLDAIQGSGSEGSGSEEGDHCGVSCDFPDPDDRLPRPDGESNDPRGKGLPISLPPVQRASQIESAGTQYAALIVRPDGSVPGADQKLLIFPLPEVPGGLAVPSSRVLGEALEAAGISRPAASAAHHIVAGRAAAAAAARAVLEKFGIGINDAANGVFLPRSAASAADAAVHAGGHKDLYYQAVNQALSAATTKEQAIKILNSIGQALQEGAFPW